MGEFTKKDNQDDVISTRHKELMKNQQEKFMTMPTHVANFLYQNLSKGLLMGFFKDYSQEEESKFATGVYEVLQIYIQLYENLQIRVIDMINAERLEA